MNRRDVLRYNVPVSGFLLGGCLELRGEPADSSDDTPATSGGPTPTTTTNDQDDSDMQSDSETQFAVLDVRTTDVTTSASVIFEDDTIAITGTILGYNTCYTARLERVTTDDSTVLVAIESYEDAEEGKGCYDAEVEIEYELVLVLEGEPPASVTVKHNGDVVTTERRS